LVVRNRVLRLIAPLIISGVMAAMAYTSADINSPADAMVVRTDAALLALSCNEGVGYKDETCWIDEDGLLRLDFAKGWREPGEITLVDPQIVDVTWVRQVLGEENNGWRFVEYEVTLTDDRGHTYTEVFGPMPTFKWDEDDFDYTISQDGRCIEAIVGIEFPSEGTVTYLTGEMCIPDDHKHVASGFYGFQPGSTYRFHKLVQVTNNSEDSIDVSVSLKGDIGEKSDLLGLQVTSGDNDEVDLLADGSVLRLGPGQAAFINFTFAVPKNFAQLHEVEFVDGSERFTFTGDVVVHGVAVE